ncbi:MAG: sialidase family protein, partial [Candidatus Firestonebacteria bacterium]
MKKILLLSLLLFCGTQLLFAAPVSIGSSIDGISNAYNTDYWDNGTGLGQPPQRTVFQTNDQKYYILLADAGWDIFFKVSSDKGATWGSASTIVTNSAVPPTNVGAPCLTGYLDSSNNLYVLFLGDSANINNVNYMKLTYSGSGNWTSGSVLKISPPGNNRDCPQIVKDSTGKLWVSYYADGTGTGGPHILTSDDDGGTWSPEITNFGAGNLNTGRNYSMPLMALFQDKPMVFYAIYSNAYPSLGTSPICYRYWDGSTWVPTLGTAATVVPNSGPTHYFSGQYSVAKNNYGGIETLHLAYYNNNNNRTDAKLCYQRLSGSPTNWTGYTKIATIDYAATDTIINVQPKIVTSGNDLYCFWLKYDTSKQDYDIVYSKSSDNGVTWAAPVTAYTSPNPLWFSKVLLYSSRFGTYEDKTTEAGNATAADVKNSVSGKLVSLGGDAVYFGSGT